MTLLNIVILARSPKKLVILVFVLLGIALYAPQEGIRRDRKVRWLKTRLILAPSEELRSE